MKLKSIFILLFAFSLQHSWAQEHTLKHALSEKDKQSIETSISDCFGFSSNFKVSYSTSDLFAPTVVVDKPASLEEIEKLKLNIDGTDEDANTYLDISSNYSRLGMYKEANEYSSKSIDITKKFIEANPDSIAGYFSLGSIYMGRTEIEKSIEAFKTCQKLDPKNGTFPMMIGMLYYMTGNYDEGIRMIDEFYVSNPDDKEFFKVLFMKYFYNYSKFFLQMKNVEEIKSFPLDSALNMPYVEEFYAKNKNDKNIEFTYHISQSIMMITYLTFSAAADSAFDGSNPRFNLGKYEAELVNNEVSYFEKCLKGKEKSYYMYSNRVLGGLYIILDKPIKSLSYFAKAIELKPMSNSSLSSNAVEDYNNTLVAYGILNDTLKYEQFLLNKIKVQPGIDPDVLDYTNLAGLYVAKNRLKEAGEYYNKAVEIAPNNIDALLGKCLIEYRTGDPKTALAIVEDIYRIDHSRWELFILYGGVLLKLNDEINAYESFKIAKKMHDKKWIQKELLNYFNEE